ncbi:NUDIX hydrolase [Solibacillus daqui]|uniref:NUDIX hydrolase n=1 Tax=Solibacillus daqui TaxID=2912187 RepID=UPI00236549DF|nr:NUDIX hydrolase [Solibacillus daqui]
MGYIMNLRKKIGTDPIFMVGACVLIFNERNELLMQHRIDNDCWGLAGGSMELGETLEDVALREMYEETGLTAHELSLFDIFSGKDFYYQYPHGDEVYNVSTAYICTDYSGDLRCDPEEAKDLQFFRLDSLPEHISPPDKIVIRKYLERDSENG